MKKLLLILLLSAFTTSAYTQTFDPDRIIKENPDNSEFLEKLITTAWKNNPDNRTYENKIGYYEDELTQRKLSWFDNLNLTYQYNPQSTPASSVDNNSLPKFGIGVSVNIGSILKTPSKISQGHSELRNAEYNLQTQKLFVRAEVTRRYSYYKGNLNLYRIRTQAVNDSYSSLSLLKHRYENGEAILTEYNNALRVYTDNQERQAVSEMDVQWHKANLEQMLGIKLEEVR
ncbi:hypothetical protein BH10BAC5_BH10BAC5_16320 [soil metagenome]